MRGGIPPARAPHALPPDPAALAGAALVALAVAWLPGQARAGAVRAWLAWGVLPLAVALLPGARAVPARRWLPWAGLAVLALARAPGSADPGGGLAAWVTHSGWIAALALGSLVASPGPATPGLARPAALAGALAAVPGLAVPGGAFGNPDLLAGFLVGTLALTAGGLGRGGCRRPGERLALGAAAALQVGAMVASGSLGARVAAGAGAAAWGIAWVGCRPGGRRAAVALAAGAGAASLGVLALPTVADHVRGRLHLAGISWEVARGALPLGTGPGAFHAAFLEAQAVRIAARPEAAALWTNADHAHHEGLQVLAEHGPLGLALLLAPVLAALVRPRPGPAWAAVVAYGVLGSVSPVLREPGSALLACLAVGTCLGPPGTAPEAGPGLRPRWGRPAALAAAVLALALATSDLAADRLLARGVRLGDPALLRDAARLALRPARALQYRASALMALEPEGAAALAEEAVRRDPSPRALLLVGNAWLQADRPDRALPPLLRAVRLHPRFFAGHFTLALAYADAGDPLAARRHAARARSLRPGDPRLDRLPR
ncbi:hypothetical protein L6R50_03025 [Myxococcota bacterium]|nr:hypothetical protein [Myxococcota bacterium]